MVGPLVKLAEVKEPSWTEKRKGNEGAEGKSGEGRTSIYAWAGRLDDSDTMPAKAG
jgi:hypothetical protein